MRVWRLTRRIYLSEALAGNGAARVGSRWNSIGVKIGYTSTARSLAVLEMLTHVTRDTVPDGLVLAPVEVPDHLVETASGLPADWNHLPYSRGARRYGDNWVRSGSSAALLVPSVVVPAESNLLINPLHPGFSQVRVLDAENFSFDPRLFG